jgi:hypothetical protein
MSLKNPMRDANPPPGPTLPFVRLSPRHPEPQQEIATVRPQYDRTKKSIAVQHVAPFELTMRWAVSIYRGDEAEMKR